MSAVVVVYVQVPAEMWKATNASQRSRYRQAMILRRVLMDVHLERQPGATSAYQQFRGTVELTLGGIRVERLRRKMRLIAADVQS